MNDLEYFVLELDFRRIWTANLLTNPLYRPSDYYYCFRIPHASSVHADLVAALPVCDTPLVLSKRLVASTFDLDIFDRRYIRRLPEEQQLPEKPLGFAMWSDRIEFERYSQSAVYHVHGH